MAFAEKYSEEYPASFPDRATQKLWQPAWLVDIGQAIWVGIAMDHGCYVVLAQTPTGQWWPMTHIPVEVAKILARLADG